MTISSVIARRRPPQAPVTAAADPHDRPARAILLILAAMFVFIMMDGISKFLAGTMPAEQIIWVRYGFVMLLLLPALWRHRAARPFATTMPLHHVGRGLLLLGSALIFVYALEYLPLETATAIGFVSPLYVTALSIPLLGEQVGARRWAAVAIGFGGVLMILRPGTDSFSAAMLLPMLSSFCWAIGLIITRKMRGSERPLTVLFYSTLVGWLAIAFFALPLWRQPEGAEWLLLAATGVCHMLGQYLLIRAFMIGAASMLAPFSYSTILWAGLIGAVFFDTLPDAATVAGTAILITAGIYVWHRERVRAVPATVPGASIAEAAENA